MIYDFLYRHPVFTRSEFERYREEAGASIKPAAIQQLLEHHCAKGIVVRLRNNLYAANLGKQETVAPLAFLVASKLAPDSVLTAHTVMDARGQAYSVFNTFYYLTCQHVRVFEYRHQTYQAIQPPKAILEKNAFFTETETVYFMEQPVKMTTIERTLVDSLNYPLLAGGWEELWRNFDMVQSFRWDNLANYIHLFDNAHLHAKLGFYLAMRQQYGLDVPDSLLAELAAKSPATPRYIDQRKRFFPNQPWQLVKPWQLIVPTELMTQNWEEVYRYGDSDY